MLLASLNPAAVAAGADIGDAVRIDGTTLSRSDLVGAATSVAERVAGANRVAVLATPTPATVLGDRRLPDRRRAGRAGARRRRRRRAAPHPHRLRRAGVAGGQARTTTDGWRTSRCGCTPGRGIATPNRPPEATALIIYTSGTTGLPKGVVVSRRAIAADIDMLAEAWQWTPEDTLVHGLPLYHVHGLVLGLLGSLRIGNRFVHTGKPNPAAYAQAVRGRRIAVLRGADGVVAGRRRRRRGARAGAGPAAGLGQRAAAGAGVRRAAGAERAPAVERYGSTESLITLSTRADGERRPGWVGLPLAGVQTRLVAEDGAGVPHDGETIGRLQVRSPTMFDGYLNRPDATAEVLGADGWYRTGDVAVIDDGGMHRIVGRESVDLIKTGGFRVGAGEIETVLLGHPGVREAAVIGAPDDDLGQRIVAFVVG